MLQTGGAEPADEALAQRLDAAYYGLTRTTERHFGQMRDGWFLSGVAGLDAPTMNRAVVQDVAAEDVAHLVDDARDFFDERHCAWSVTLATFRGIGNLHAELLMRGMALSTTLDVLMRRPGPISGSVPDVPVRPVEASEMGTFTDLLVDVFRMPRRFYPALLEMTDAWRRHGAKLYFGLDDEGEPVSTALVAEQDGVAGIYNVGTIRRARRRGHARALMARLLEDAAAADVVTLQVAPDGFVEGFYRRLDFRPVYQWRFYTPRARWGLFGR